MIICKNLTHLRSDNIKEKYHNFKESIYVYFQEKNSQLFFIIGLLTGIIFMLININKDMIFAVLFLVIGIIIFEFFNYYYGETPDIIITDHEDVEKTYSYIKKTVQESIEESKNNQDSDKVD